MVNYLKELQVASYQGVEFYVDTEQTTCGRKVAIHDYPNSPVRFVEDLGKMPQEFTIDCFVSGENWQSDAEAFEKVLSDGSQGNLTLPVLGSHDNIAVIGTPSVSSDNSGNLGMIRFSVTFSETKQDAAPAGKGAMKESVYGAGDLARVAIQDVFQEQWIIPNSQANALVSQFDIASAVENMNSIFSTPTGSVSSDVQSAIDLISNNIPVLSIEPGTLAKAFGSGNDSMTGLWQSLSENFQGGEAFDSAINAIPFGQELLKSFTEIRSAQDSQEYPVSTGDTVKQSSITPLWPPTTAERIERNYNRILIVEIMRLNALIIAYEQAAVKEYSTAEEIDNNLRQLAESYSYIFKADTRGRILTDDFAIKNVFDQVKSEALKLIDMKKQRSYKQTLIEYGGVVGATTLAYMIYAEDVVSTIDLEERAELLSGMNQANNSTVLTGNIIAVEKGVAS